MEGKPPKSLFKPCSRASISELKLFIEDIDKAIEKPGNVVFADLCVKFFKRFQIMTERDFSKVIIPKFGIARIKHWSADGFGKKYHGMPPTPYQKKVLCRLKTFVIETIKAKEKKNGKSSTFQ